MAKANTKPITNTRGPLTSKSRYPTIGRISDATFTSLIGLMVIAFAPLSWTYFLDETRTSNWTDKVLAVLVSPEFAYGPGSGSWTDGQLAVLVRNIGGMFPHTIAGSVAIVVGLAQFSRTLQYQYPVVHRSLGRIYFLCATIICGSSASFLLDTVPTKEVFSGEVFSLNLSVLTLGTVATMVLALRAIWQGDVSSHREFMVLNYALMLSAPILRVFWVLLSLFWVETKYIINLFSTIWTGPLLLMASIFYLRRRYSRPAHAGLMDPRLRVASAVLGGVGFAFCIYRLPPLTQWAYPAATFWAIVPQWLFQAGTFTALAARAKSRGDMGAYAAWVTYQNGLLSGPVWAIPAFYISRDLYGCPAEWIGLSTVSFAWVQGLSMAYVGYVLATAKPAKAVQLSEKA